MNEVEVVLIHCYIYTVTLVQVIDYTECRVTLMAMHNSYLYISNLNFMKPSKAHTKKS